MVYIDTSALKENVMADKDGNIHKSEAQEIRRRILTNIE